MMHARCEERDRWWVRSRAHALVEVIRPRTRHERPRRTRATWHGGRLHSTSGDGREFSRWVAEISTRHRTVCQTRTSDGCRMPELPSDSHFGGNISHLAPSCFALKPEGASAAAFGITIVVLLAYGRIASPAASVDRAITAATVFLAGRLLDHRGPPLNALAVAAIFSAAVWPAAPLDAGFLLSFGATLGSSSSRRGFWRGTAGPQDDVTPRARGRGAARGDGLRRHRAGADQCRGVRPDHVRRAASELCGNPVDERRAGCRHRRSCGWPVLAASPRRGFARKSPRRRSIRAGVRLSLGGGHARRPCGAGRRTHCGPGRPTHPNVRWSVTVG